jgi:hypothetical protein
MVRPLESSAGAPGERKSALLYSMLAIPAVDHRSPTLRVFAPLRDTFSANSQARHEDERKKRISQSRKALTSAEPLENSTPTVPRAPSRATPLCAWGAQASGAGRRSLTRCRLDLAQASARVSHSPPLNPAHARFQICPAPPHGRFFWGTRQVAGHGPFGQPSAGYLAPLGSPTLSPRPFAPANCIVPATRKNPK